ncbi:MAG: alpha-ketoacid dehydrogenase subunit beta [Dehalococcoidales bacterium]|nr:alpha-ketoacid dehydrogenase subunit beta [Dehalococcoidales bacterium]MDZ4230592.1 alpha-ketoacid dehydrogenase subunit beta [Dehalococcoidales bacterium]
MRELSFTEAIREALREEMRRDPRVYVIGLDAGIRPGVSKVTTGFEEEFGSDRVISAPIAEGIIAGSSVGAALMGMRPVAELLVADFMSAAMEPMFTSASRARYVSDGGAKVPLVLRTRVGGVGQYVASVEAWFVHIPGLKVVMPSTPYDAKGLLKSSIRDDNPVIFFEHGSLHQDMKGPVPEEEYTIPLGVADIKRTGSDVTVVAAAKMVHEALAAAEELAQESISVEVLDLRSLYPIDKTMLLNSVRKTGRLIVAHQAWKTAGIGAEISAIVAEEALGALKAPVARVATPDVPVPTAYPLQRLVLPGKDDISSAVRKVMA